MRARQRERDEFVALMTRELAQHSERTVSELCRKLMWNAPGYTRIQEAWCSVEMSDSQTKRTERREAQIEQHIRKLCEPFGIVPVFNGDPRGATIKLKLPSGRTNDWAQAGVCVPGA